jgi:hypothetical protein
VSIWDRIKGSVTKTNSAAYNYPLERHNHRTIPDDFVGHVYTWDIDKTYLASDFETFKGMLSIPFEFAIDKRNIAGTDTLLRLLRRNSLKDEANGLYFISASPVQLRATIEKKMLLDGVEYDGITLKDQIGLLKAGKIKRLNKQVGYKLSALLLNRRELPWTVKEVLFGDDSESDALIYGIYADIVAGRLRGEDLETRLLAEGIPGDEAGYVRSLAEGIPSKARVERIYIHLERRSPPERFEPWAPMVTPCYDTLQTTILLVQDGMLPPDAIVEVAQNLGTNHGYGPIATLRSVADLIERNLIVPEQVEPFWDELTTMGMLPSWLEIRSQFKKGALLQRQPIDPAEMVTPPLH